MVIIQTYSIKTAIVLLFVMLLNLKCSWFESQEDQLSFSRTPCKENKLKLDGYYYRSLSFDHIEIYFFYRNGNLLYGTATNLGGLENLESFFSNGKYYEHAKNDNTFWGIFRITGNTIEYERWVPADGMGSAPIYRYTGTILNDTTFQMYSSCRVDGTDENPYNYVFKFKRFSPKPDSVTKFIP